MSDGTALTCHPIATTRHTRRRAERVENRKSRQKKQNGFFGFFLGGIEMARWQKPHHDCAFHTHSSNCDGRIYHPAMWTLRFAAPANCSAHHLLSTHATAIVRRKIASIGRRGRFRCCNRTVVVRYSTKRQRYIDTSPETRSTNQPKHKFRKSLCVAH